MRVSGHGVVDWPVHLRAGCLVQEGPGWRLRQLDIPERATHANEVCGVDVAPKSGNAGGRGSGGGDEGQPGRYGNSSWGVPPPLAMEMDGQAPALAPSDGTEPATVNARGDPFRSAPSKDIGWDEAANRCQVEGPSES